MSSKSAGNFCFSAPLHASHRKNKILSLTQSIFESFKVKKARLTTFSIKNAGEKIVQEKVIFSRKDRNLDITVSVS